MTLPVYLDLTGEGEQASEHTTPTPSLPPPSSGLKTVITSTPPTPPTPPATLSTPSDSDNDLSFMDLAKRLQGVGSRKVKPVTSPKPTPTPMPVIEEDESEQKDTFPPPPPPLTCVNSDVNNPTAGTSATDNSSSLTDANHPATQASTPTSDSSSVGGKEEFDNGDEPGEWEEEEVPAAAEGEDSSDDNDVGIYQNHPLPAQNTSEVDVNVPSRSPPARPPPPLLPRGGGTRSVRGARRGGGSVRGRAPTRSNPPRRAKTEHKVLSNRGWRH